MAEERTLHIIQKIGHIFAGQVAMTRQEAIDKISFALMEEGIDETDCACLAEAALNALLER